MQYQNESVNAKKEMLSDCVKKLGAAVDKFKSDGSLSATELDEIRGLVAEAKNTAGMYMDINQDTTGKFGLVMEFSNLLDKAISVVGHDHLI
ncbi:hypothetical protein [Methylomonas sp. MgM2]